MLHTFNITVESTVSEALHGREELVRSVDAYLRLFLTRTWMQSHPWPQPAAACRTMSAQ
jgi:hypothetical protein